MSGTRAGETKQAEDLRFRLPRGASKIRIVRLFQGGLPVEYLAALIGCAPSVIEDVIREAMRRQS